MKKLLSTTLILLFLRTLLSRPETVSAAVEQGLTLCLRAVIPSLFPFLAAAGLLLRLGAAHRLQWLCAPLMGPLFRLPGGAAAALLAGATGGYPTGAKTVADLHAQGLLTRRQAEAALSFSNNCGPAFLLSFVGGGIFGSTRIGVHLLLIHLLSALLSGAVLCRAAGLRPCDRTCRLPPPSAQPLAAALPAAVADALAATLNICAFVVLFRIIAQLLPEQMPGAVLGLCEMVTGLSALSPDRAGFVAAAAIVSWGGLSVHCQTLAVLSGSGLSPRWHWAGKVMQTMLAAMLAAAVTFRA